jgi:hypothetical protein
MQTCHITPALGFPSCPTLGSSKILLDINIDTSLLDTTFDINLFNFIYIFFDKELYLHMDVSRHVC